MSDFINKALGSEKMEEYGDEAFLLEEEGPNTKTAALEVLRQKLTGWSKVLAPFLIQNIGWFISAFLFVAGSVFVVACTEGVLKTLIIALSLFAYTLMLALGAYQMRKRRPDLRTTAEVLATLAMFLIPVSILASSRLFAGSVQSGFIAGLILMSMNVIVFYYAAKVLSRIMDSSIDRSHARTFITLGALQLGAPIVDYYGAWQILAFFHFSLLALLTYTFHHYNKSWFNSLFIERRKIALYIMGTLVYSAIVTFMHLTWLFSGDLPRGYYGPFLMMLTGLLFYMDSSFKEITKKYTFLSKMNFALYGLSIFSIVITMGSTGAKTITLAMGAVVYGMVLRNYLTTVPLYLMLGCLGWLYGIIILDGLPKGAFFMASLPAMVGLFELHRRLSLRGAKKLARNSFYLLTASFGVLAAWSLIGSAPSFITFVTTLTMSGFIYFLFYFAPFYVFTALGLKHDVILKFLGKEQDLRNRPFFYVIPLSLLLTAAYAPPFLKAGTPWQFAMACLILGNLWAVMAVRRIEKKYSFNSRAIMLANSSLGAVILSLAVILFQGPDSGNPYLHLALLLSGGITISLAIAFGMRILVYGGTFLAAVGIVLVRHTYVPWPSTGLLEMVAVICLWGGLRLVELKKSTLFYESISCEGRQSFKLLGFLPVTGLSPYDTIRPVLRQAVPLLWTVSIILMTRNLLIHGFTMQWSASAALAALSTMPLLAYYNKVKYWALPLFFGLLSVSGFAYCLGYTSAIERTSVITYFSLMTWLATVYLQKHSISRKLAYLTGVACDEEKRGEKIENATYLTSYILSIVAIIPSLVMWSINMETLAIIPLFTGTAFFFLSGIRYGHKINSYAVISGGVAIGAIIYCKLFSFAVEDLFVHSLAATFWPLTGLSLWLIVKAMEWGKFAALKEITAKLYARPMRETAIVLAFIGALFQIIPINIHPIEMWEIMVLALSSVVILVAGHKLANTAVNLTGVIITSLTLLNIESFLFEGGVRLSLWPESGGQWLTVSLVALAGAGLSAKLAKTAQGYSLYAKPVRIVAGMAYLWVSMGLVPLFGAAISAKSVASYVPALFLIQGISLFPLLHNFSEREKIQGAIQPFLLTGFVAASLPFTGIPWNGMTIFSWALALWAAANYGVPLFNKRYPHLALASSLWPFVGLVLFAIIYPVMIAKGNLLLNWPYWLCTAIYCFLLLKNNRSFIIYHIAVAFLAMTGISVAASVSGGRYFHMDRFLTWAIIWTNLLFLFGRAIKTYDSTIVEKFQWEKYRAASPFIAWGHLLTSLGILWLFLIDMVLFLIGHISMSDLKEIFPFAGLLVFASIQLYSLQKTRWNVWQMLLAIFFVSLLPLNAFWKPLTHLSLLLSIWGMVLIVVESFLAKDIDSGKDLSRITSVIKVWTKYLPWLSLVALVSFPIASLRESILVLTLVTAVVAMRGWENRSENGIFRARILGLVLLHTWPLLFLPPGKASGLYLYQVWPILCAQFERLQVLFPWYALQLSLVSLILMRVKKSFTEKALETYPQLKGLMRNPAIEVFVALFFLSLHFIAFIQSLNPMAPAYAWINGSAALLSGAILIVTGLKKAVQKGENQAIYGLILLAGIMGIYVRLLIMGLSPLTFWDTAALVAIAYGFFILEEVVQLPILLKPFAQVSVILPLLALFTVPLQAASPSAASVLLAAGALYMTRHFVKGEPLMLYLGVATANAAIYLWIPVWVAQSSAIQLYTVPAALSVLILLQLHRGEIKPSVLNNIRLAALCVLYASSSIDIFLRPEFWIFALFLFLALSGVALGIMLRIRVFLYSSVAFLVINVMAQLLRFYPEEGLGKGILLMVCGAVIMGGMVWFNVKRESIMKTVRIYRADLARWE